jgi:hypothetical protein
MFCQLAEEVVDLGVVVNLVSFCGHNCVIHIDPQPSLGDLFLEDIIHHCLESGQRVGQAEEHNCWFEESLTCLKSCFPFIALFNADVVVAPSNVEFGKQLFPS